MQQQLEQGELIRSSDGLQWFATSDPDLLILAFDRPDVCGLALVLQGLIGRHALATSFVDPWGAKAFLVKRLKPLQIALEVHSDRQATRLRWLRTDGTEVPKAQAGALSGLNPECFDAMADTATHAGRSLRAHMALLGTAQVRIRLNFGLGSAGECLPEVVNPLVCDLGSTDYASLAGKLEGGSS